MNDMLADGMLGGGAAASAESLYDKTTSKDSCCPSLSARVRLVGFLICFFVGLIITYVAIGAVSAEDQTVWRFLIPYVIGTSLMIASLFFMSGPKK
eukprot:CAMPEP_0116879438 /NCGR_PEP_ID=MMETSP0463-20121206/11253_1 /TAXON_ID=181622 /ORGANISM="Strombidinopsis sp, Strain SopsisLIS2011" /LENGTH=95 /DNA_ID=CAMNT_0004528789 /DNA_START=12 /DNA_END=299 /DNA_ORIENTATION=-